MMTAGIRRKENRLRIAVPIAPLDVLLQAFGFWLRPPAIVLPLELQKSRFSPQKRGKLAPFGFGELVLCAVEARLGIHFCGFWSLCFGSGRSGAPRRLICRKTFFPSFMFLKLPPFRAIENI